MKPSGSRSPDERSTCRRGRTYGGADAETRQEDRRTRIEESALDLFASRGYRHTTVSMICEHARVSRRHFYELFDDREAVLRHVYDLVQARTREPCSRRSVLTSASTADGATPPLW